MLGDSHVDDGTISFLMVQIMEETGSNLGHETRYSDGGVLFFLSPSGQIAPFIPHNYQLILQSTCSSTVYIFDSLTVP